jgi:hypothetical protein
MLNRQELQVAVEGVLEDALERIWSAVPHINHLLDDSRELNEMYYLRHRVETIKRIRMTSKTDALALACMVDEDYQAARWWAKYLAQELTHDLLYLKDLKKHGYTDEMVDSIKPFHSTIAMLDYLTTKIESIGSLPAVAYSVCVEWNSERVSAKVVERVEKRFSPSHVSGSNAHVAIDENEDHYSTMLDVVYRLLVKQGSEQVLFDLLRDISNFLGDYFHELYKETIVPCTLDPTIND